MSGPSTSLKTNTALEYSLKYPNAGHRTVARSLCADHPTMFPTLEATRSIVQRLRGARRDTNRMIVRDQKETAFKPLMPVSQAEDHAPVGLTGDHRTLIMSDIHFPFHSEVALESAIQYAKKRNPTLVILNGDTVDNFATSRWEPDVRKRNVAGEMEVCRQGLAYIRSLFPKARIAFKHGNHEDRWVAYMNKNCPVLLGVPEFELASILGLDDLGIEEVGSRTLMTLGHLTVLHGHELPKGIASPVNAARGLYMRLGASAICGHWHQRSMHSETVGPAFDKRHIAAWTTGALCDLAPDYAQINKWSHGFAFVESKATGEFEVDNLCIIDGKVF